MVGCFSFYVSYRGRGNGGAVVKGMGGFKDSLKVEGTTIVIGVSVCNEGEEGGRQAGRKGGREGSVTDSAGSGSLAGEGRGRHGRKGRERERRERGREGRVAGWEEERKLLVWISGPTKLGRRVKAFRSRTC